MKNTISHRVADFLKNFPPFSFLQQKELETISSQISIIYKEKNSIIFAENEDTHDSFYVVHKGVVALKTRQFNDILDMCDEGDVFGLRPLIANENYQMGAVAYEESILYAIPITVFRPYALENKAVGNFLIESFASNTLQPYSKSHRSKLYGDELDSDAKLLDLQPIKYSKKLISCSEITSAAEIAEIMTKKNVGAVLVLKNTLPIGIITDKDLRNKVVTGKYPITAFASEIMTTPVVTYPKKLTVTQAQIALMKSDISHLCITKDGTVNSKAVGILSKHDVMVSLGNNPSVLIKAIKRTKKAKKLKSIRASIMILLQGYIEQNIPLMLTSKIITELNDACIKQIIEISLTKMNTPPPVKFAWLALGSQGRSEQLLQTDQDNALIYEDVPNKELKEATKKYFTELAIHINKGLFEIGYDYCPAEMMASNPKWCLSLQEWKETVFHWITNTGKNEVLLSFIFFDYSLSYGDSKLSNSLSDYIFETIKANPVFYAHLVSGALQSPSPTGFFREFLLEEDGVNKDFFDIKKRALMPLADAARVLILFHSVKSISNTVLRFEKLAELEPENGELYLACANAYKVLLKFRTTQGLLHNDSGQFITLESLSKSEKIKLKSTFKTIKELQEIITLKFNISNLV